MIIFFSLSLVANLFLYYLSMTAPMGYEDENGFHFEEEN
jgi:hypothetical protein